MNKQAISDQMNRSHIELGKTLVADKKRKIFGPGYILIHNLVKQTTVNAIVFKLQLIY